MTELRAHLSGWLDRVRGGEEVVVTDHGLPVARLVQMEATSLLQRLTEKGVIGRPAVAVRPIASGRPKVAAKESIADLISEQRG